MANATSLSGSGIPNQCFSNFDSLGGASNIWSGTGFRTEILLFGYWSFYPQQEVALITIATVTMALVIATLGLFGNRIAKNPNRVPMATNPSSNVFPWWKNVVFPITVLIWQFSLGIVYITNALTGFTSTTAEAIFVQGLVEDFALSVTILLFVSQAISWDFTLKYGLIALSVYAILQVLFASTGNAYIQGLFGIISLIGDAGNPIMTTVYLARKASSFQLIMADALFINHIFAFIVPAAICMFPSVVSTYMVALAGFNLLILATYCFALVNRWNDDVIPSLF
jgi:hypothetical protein